MENASIPTGEGLTFEKVWQMFQELREEFRETDLRIKETDSQIKETNKLITRIENDFTDRYGRFVESLIEGNLTELLAGRGIHNCGVSGNSKYPFRKTYYEFDLIASNDSEVVVVEVKTTLKVQDIKDFLEKLPYFREMAPAYSNYKVHGAMAYLRSHPSTNLFAARNGLFVIRATGNSATIINEPGFVPKLF